MYFIVLIPDQWHNCNTGFRAYLVLLLCGGFRPCWQKKHFFWNRSPFFPNLRRLWWIPLPGSSALWCGKVRNSNGLCSLKNVIWFARLILKFKCFSFLLKKCLIAKNALLNKKLMIPANWRWWASFVSHTCSNTFEPVLTWLWISISAIEVIGCNFRSMEKTIMPSFVDFHGSRGFHVAMPWMSFSPKTFTHCTLVSTLIFSPRYIMTQQKSPHDSFFLQTLFKLVRVLVVCHLVSGSTKSVLIMRFNVKMLGEFESCASSSVLPMCPMQ